MAHGLDRWGHRRGDRGKGSFGDHSYPGALKQPGIRAATTISTAMAELDIALV